MQYTPHCRIMAPLAHAMKSMREKYLALGADDNPVKPVTNAELLHALTLCLGQKSPKETADK
jgi:CheY-like chemotaxis protein